MLSQGKKEGRERGSWLERWKRCKIERRRGWLRVRVSWRMKIKNMTKVLYRCTCHMIYNYWLVCMGDYVKQTDEMYTHTRIIYRHIYYTRNIIYTQYTVGDGVSVDGVKSDLPEEGPSSGKKPRIAGLYRPPTHDELCTLKETQNLFQSNLMRLQVNYKIVTHTHTHAHVHTYTHTRAHTSTYQHVCIRLN